MKAINKIIICALVIVMLLGGVYTPPIAYAASTKFPSETNPFNTGVYLDRINKDSPFFDEVLPQIRENIVENNKHTINPYYDALPLCTNTENFKGLGSTTYANINGKTVTAEAFYRCRDESLNDPICGMGLLIYQCIEYKRAHPDEDVKITFSSYRTAVASAVCVIPESKYYGYVRSLYTTNYDEHGFVRISYMLTEAARMGMEVTIVNHLNSYGVLQYNPKTKKLEGRAALKMKTYFTNARNSACYNKYAKGKKVSDFMTCTNVDWTIDDKTCDMQHIKSATVSHYLATDGTEHGPSIFVTSSNLDENDYKGANGNNDSQTGCIISDHDELYRVTYNFTQLMTKYQGQEDVYKLRRYVNETNEKQIELINSGREDEIPKDEQIVYLGSETDKVFELYFTPFGGTTDAWDIVHNPFCKYMSKFAKSTNYVELFWNEFGYDNVYYVCRMYEKLIEKAYCTNPNVRNKISLCVTGFNSYGIQNLKLGREIGARSIKDGSYMHSKDILMSYEENGVRHNVSLVTSCNFYMNAFNYRTNSVLVINETEETGGNYYDIMAEKYSYEMVNNDLMFDPQNLALKVGETYTPAIKYSGNNELTWSIDKPSVASIDNGTITALQKGSAIITVTDGVLSATLSLKVDDCLDCIYANGLTCNINEQYTLSKKLKSMPIAFRIAFKVNKSKLKSVNTLISSDDSYSQAISIFLNKAGNPCFMVRDSAGNKTEKIYEFSDVNAATGSDVHLTLSYVPAKKYINCYINGVWATRFLNIADIPSFVEKFNYVIGGDYKNGNDTYFPGIIKEVSIWGNSKGEVFLLDEYKNGTNYNDADLLAAYDLKKCSTCMLKDLSPNNNDLVRVPLWQDKEDVEPVGDYYYSFAVIGDTQTMCENDPAAMESIYDWLIENKESQKIEYVMGLGDITDDSTDGEWADATKFIGNLNGKIPYSLVRGNHDDWDDFNRLLHNGYYETTVDGLMNSGDVELTDPNQPGLIEKTLEDGTVIYVTREEDEPEGGIVTGDLTNSYRYLTVGEIDYLIMTLDFAPNEETLSWVDSVIEAHPNHRVIITTHAYMYRDGTTISDEDCYPPTYYSGYDNAQNGDDMWEKCFSKHKNIVMVLSGHDPWQHIVYRQDQGVNGNTVTQMLIDAQYVDRNIGSTAMVAMLYFSNNSNTVTVRYYSVAKDCYGSVLSQFTVDLGVLPNTDELSNNDENSNQTNLPMPEQSSNTNITETLMQVPNYAGNVNVAETNKKPVATKVTLEATENVTASATKTTVTLNWGKVNNATGYKIYKYNSKTKKYEYLKSTSKTQLKVSKLKTGTIYKFKIRAYKKGDKEVLGDYSSAVSVTTKLSAPKLKAKSSSKGKIQLSWSNVKGESGYQVYYKTSKNGKYKKLRSYKTDVLKGAKSKLKSNKTYYFKVRAYKKTSSKTVYSAWSSVKVVKVK